MSAGGGGHTFHVLVNKDPPVLLTCKSSAGGRCAMCQKTQHRMIDAAYFATIEGAPFAYVVCQRCAKACHVPCEKARGDQETHLR